MDKELNDAIEKDLAIKLPDRIDMDELIEKLAQHINHLIQHDFEKLVFLLYRIDVNETKLIQLLDQSNNKDSGELIAKLIIERQLQKIKTRKEFDQQNNISEEEKW